MIGILDKIIEKINKGNARSIKASRNILYSFIIKGASVVVNFLLVSTTLNYIDSKQYGIWLTLTSVFSWFVIFDFGMGNGLRNKIAEAVAKEDFKEAKILVSSTYAFLSVIGLSSLLIFSAGFLLFDWSSLIFAYAYGKEVILICFFSFVFQLVLQLINSILLACHEASRSALIILIGQAASLLVILILKYTTESSLLFLSLAVTLPPLITYFAATVILFNSSFRSFSPSFRYVNFKNLKTTGDQGWKFFIISISVALLYFSNNIIINYFFGPEEVTTYNICYKYFNVFTFTFGIIVTPFWSSYTDAYYKNDFEWIRNAIKKLLMVWMGLALVVVVAVLFSNTFYSLWVGKAVEVPFLLSLFMGIYVLINSWNSIYLYLLNGIGTISIQLMLHLTNIILILPLIFFFIKKCDLGLSAVIMAHVLCQLMFSVMAPIQVKKILSNKANGWWKK